MEGCGAGGAACSTRSRLKDLGGEGVGPVLQWDLYINTAPNVQIKGFWTPGTAYTKD